MLNQVNLVGRLVEEPEKSVAEDETFILAIPRSYKNEDGEYLTDFIRFVTRLNIAENFVEYCHKGDIIGVKGRIEGDEYSAIIVAEKITFISSKLNDED